jgi:hypothetical protein
LSWVLSAEVDLNCMFVGGCVVFSTGSSLTAWRLSYINLHSMLFCSNCYGRRNNDIASKFICKHPTFWVSSVIATGARVFLFSDGSKCSSSNTTAVAKQLCQSVSPLNEIFNPNHDTHCMKKCRSDKALTASYAACSLSTILDIFSKSKTVH